MSDVDLGTLEATIRVNAEQVDKAATEAVKQLQKIGSEALNSSKTASNAFENLTVDKLDAKVQKLTASFETQKKKVAELDTILGAAADQYKALETSMGRNGDFDLGKTFPKLTAEYDAEFAKLEELRRQLDLTVQSREQAASKAVESTRKQAEAAEVAAQRLGSQDTRQGLTMLTSGLRSVDTAAGGAVSGIGSIISQVGVLRQSMRQGGTDSAKWGTAIAGGIGIAVSIIAIGIQQIKKMEEERREAFEEAIADTSRYAEEVATVERNISVMQDSKTAVEDVAAARNSLANVLKDVVIGYDKEGNAILAGNAILKERIELLKKENQLNRTKLLTSANDPLGELRKAKEEFETAKAEAEKHISEFESKVGQAYIKGASQTYEEGIKLGFDDRRTFREALNGTEVDEYVRKATEAEEKFLAKAQETTAFIRATLQDRIAGYDDLTSAQKIAVDDMINKNVKNISNKADATKQYEMMVNVVDRVNEALANPDALDALGRSLATVKDTMQMVSDAMDKVKESTTSGLSELQNLSDVYQRLADGQRLSVAEMYELASAYPQVAQYIAETGDLTLREGEIIEIVAKARADAFVGEQNFHIQSLESLKETVKQKIKAIYDEINAYDTLMDVLKQTQLAQQMNDAKQHLADLDVQIDAAKTTIDAAKGSLVSLGSASKGASSVSKAVSETNEALREELKLLEHKKKMGEVNYQEELNWLNRLLAQYKLSADERMDLEYRIYSAKQKLREEEEKALQEQIKTLDSFGAALVSALKARYDEQEKLEEGRIKDSIKSWQTWEKETVAAIQGQIHALDELERQQDSSDKRAEYEREKQALELQKAYATDLYQREQIQKEINRLDLAEQERLAQEERDEMRRQLQAQIDAAREESQIRQDALSEEADALRDQYAKLTSTAALTAEAQKTLMASSQDELLSLLHSYAPEYEVIGKSFGEKMMDGFASKVGGNLLGWFENLQARISEYTDNVAYTAQKAAEQFYASRQAYANSIDAMGAPASGVSIGEISIHIDQPVNSALDAARIGEIAYEEFLYKLKGGR